MASDVEVSDCDPEEGLGTLHVFTPPSADLSQEGHTSLRAETQSVVLSPLPSAHPMSHSGVDDLKDSLHEFAGVTDSECRSIDKDDRSICTGFSVAVLVFLASFESRTDKTQTKLQKRLAAVVLTTTTTLLAPVAVLILTLVSTERFFPLLLWMALFVALSVALLFYMFVTKQGLKVVQFHVSLFGLTSGLSLWLCYKAAPLVTYFGFHVLTLLAYLLTGGMESGWSGVVVLTMSHIVLLTFCHLHDYLVYECEWLRLEDVSCVFVYANSFLSGVLLDCMGTSLVWKLVEKLEHEKMVGDAILDNCLPRSISTDIKEQISSALNEASRLVSHRVVKSHLKERPELIGFYVDASVGVHQNVSVLFADICSFTQVSSKVSAQLLVRTLRDIFQEIDWLCIMYDVEKIKTIGDCYMACGNLSRRSDETTAHSVESAVNIVKLARSIVHRKFFLGTEPVQFRVGIHSGPVVSGVIGLTKFCLDIWGDTVNMASRTESTGIKGKVNVSYTTFLLTKEHFKFVPRPHVSMKGVDQLVTTYVMDDPADDVAFSESMHDRLREEWESSTRIDKCKRDKSRTLFTSTSFTDVNPLSHPSFNRDLSIASYSLQQEARIQIDSAMQDHQEESGMHMHDTTSLVNSSDGERSTRTSNSSRVSVVSIISTKSLKGAESPLVVGPTFFSNERPASVSSLGHKNSGRKSRVVSKTVSASVNKRDSSTRVYDSIEEWLVSMGLSDFACVFRENKWDLDNLHDLKESGIDRMGITGSNKKLILDYLRAHMSPPPSPSPVEPFSQRGLLMA